MDAYKVRNEVLSILNAIDDLKDEMNAVKDLEWGENWRQDSEAMEQQIDAYEDTIESLEWDLSEIVEELIKDARNNEAEAAAMEREEKFFARKKRWALERAENDRKLAQYTMERRDEKKVKGDLFSVSIVKNGGKRGIQLICDPKDLPERFRTEKVEYSLNQEEARKALDAGEDGLKFYYKPQGEHLSIR